MAKVKDKDEDGGLERRKPPLFSLKRNVSHATFSFKSHNDSSTNLAPSDHHQHHHSSHEKNENSNPQERPSRSVWIIRTLFLFSLLVVALLLGLLSFRIVSKSEQDLAQQQWEALADRAMDLGEELAIRRRVVVRSMSKIAASAFPNAGQDWPNVAIPAFGQIARDLSSMALKSFTQQVVFYPMVIPEQNSTNATQQASFEAFAYDYFYNTRGFSSETAVHSFGRGIWKTQEGTGTLKLRIRDSIGDTSKWKGQRRVLFPLFQSSDDNTQLGRLSLMHNAHAVKSTGEPIEEVMSCSDARRQSQDVDMDCGVVSNILYWNRESFLVQPIFPSNDMYTLTGVIMSRVSWDDTMSMIFQDSLATGITAVLSSEGKTYSYRVNHGIAEFSGQGDLHDTKYSSYRRSTLLSGTVVTGFSSRQYTISIYPTDEFFDVYSTNNPTIATVGALVIVFVTSLFFLGYDFVVRREFNAKEQLLQAKRHFMRFVSHEVRTPLNAVCLGLSLLQEELKQKSSILLLNADPKNENKIQDTLKNADASDIDGNSFSSSVEQWLALTQEICDSAESSVEVLNDLLNYDKIQMGSFSLELTVFPVWKLIRDTSREFRLSAKKKNIHFELDDHGCIDPESNELSSEVCEFKVVADKVRIMQILRNLVSNALKFTPEGGNLTIHASLELNHGSSSNRMSNKKSLDKYTLKNGEEIAVKPRGAVKISVVDTGVGMSQEQLSNLFREGTQFNVNELQAGQGSGLGLFISKGIARQHGGDISATSEGLGCGSTFTLSLPFYSIQDGLFTTETTCTSQNTTMSPLNDITLEKDQLATNANGATEIVTSPGLLPSMNATDGVDSLSQVRHCSLNILVVDDVASNRKLVARMARNRKHFVDEARDGQEAVDMVAQSMQRQPSEEAKSSSHYHTILMDYEMPVMNGPDAVKKIRDLGSDVLIVGVTGNVLVEDVNHFMDCGADCVLPKPVKFQRLEEIWYEHGFFERCNYDTSMSA